MTEAGVVNEGSVIQPTTFANGRRWKTAEATVTTNETIPITGCGDLVAAVGVRKDTGAAIACTVATTVVTVTTGGLADVPCIILAIGTAP